MFRSCSKPIARRRRLIAEPLEDRRLLAGLDLLPTSGTITQENGRTVVSVAGGTKVSVNAQIVSSESPVQGFQLNLANSSTALLINNFVNGDFSGFPIDVALNSAATTPDYFVAGAVQTDLALPPIRSIGTFDVTAPSDAGDYIVTTNFTINRVIGTLLSTRQGVSIPITEFGDLVIRVTPPPPTAIIDLVPAASAGTITEENGTTVITVTPGSQLGVIAQVVNASAAVQGFQFNLSNSNPALLINSFVNGDFTPFAIDTTLNSAATPADYFVASAVQADLTIPPNRNIGIFQVTAPSVAGDYRVTANFTTTPNVATILTTRNSQAFNVTSFGDLIIRVAGTALPVATVFVASQTVNENAGTATITVNLSAASTSEVSIPFTLGGTATVGASNDYTISTNPLVITAGQTSGTITVTINDDTVDDDNETIIVTLGTPTGATLGTVASQTITITDNDPAPTTPVASISAATQTVNEIAGTATITVNLSAASTSNVSIPFTLGGTATVGAANDYTISASPLVIAAGQTSGTITVTINDDTVDDDNETIIVTLGTPTGATLGTVAAQTIAITDNDPAPGLPLVSFGAATRTVSEAVGTFTVTVSLSVSSTSSITIPYAVSGTATSGAGNDFTIAPSPLVIPAGQTSGTISLTVNNDAAAESAESITLTLGTPTGANLSTSFTQTITITDNDGGSRILNPVIAARPQVIPGDGRPTAIIFRAHEATELTVGFVGSVSLTDNIQILDSNLNSIGGRDANGVFRASLIAGSLYSVIIEGRTTEALLTLRSSAGPDSIGNSNTNILFPTDVNTDGNTTAGDALVVINRMNLDLLSGEGISSRAEGEQSTDVDVSFGYADVNADGRVSASDALAVIYELTQQDFLGAGESTNSIIHETPSALLTPPVNAQLPTSVLDTTAVDTVLTERDLNMGTFESNSNSIGLVSIMKLSPARELTVEEIDILIADGQVFEGSTDESLQLSSV